MPPEHRPVAIAFFPTARIALAIGVLVAAFGAAVIKREGPVEIEVVTSAVSPNVRPSTVSPTSISAAAHAPEGGLVGPVVAHVWLENCADCMSAFAAHARLQNEGALEGIPQVNVAYGASTPAFRAQYRVDANLIEDGDGSKVVHRYGISSFTTLVIDAKGELLLRDRPDREGYVARVRDAWSRAR